MGFAFFSVQYKTTNVRNRTGGNTASRSPDAKIRFPEVWRLFFSGAKQKNGMFSLFTDKNLTFTDFLFPHCATPIIFA